MSYNTFWGIYQQLLHSFQGIIDLDPVISAVPDTVNRINNEKLPLLPEMRELRGGDGVIGGAKNDDDHMYASFSSSSDSDSNLDDTGTD